MNMLRKLPTDGTYDQGAQANRIKSRAGNEAESIDLSSATDRFPRVLQKILLKVLVSEEFSEHWESLMTNRDFSFDNRHVRYERGQPMGLYSSWAVFALTHHVLIGFAAFRKGIKSFAKYAVLGDDVVIWDKVVSDEYKLLLSELDVPYSKDKSLTSDPSNIRIEFAKRLFLNGEEITPLSPSILMAGSKSIYDLFLVLETAVGKG